MLATGPPNIRLVATRPIAAQIPVEAAEGFGARTLYCTPSPLKQNSAGKQRPTVYTKVLRMRWLQHVFK